MIELLIKYFLEGLAVAVAAFFIPKQIKGGEISFNEVIMIGLTASATFALLDIFSIFTDSLSRQVSTYGEPTWFLKMVTCMHQ